jgi:sec-independent protein translocase protein TatA
MLAGQDLLVIMLLALILFGAKRLPEIGEGLGKGIRAFKESLRGADLEENLKKLEDKREPENPDISNKDSSQ